MALKEKYKIYLIVRRNIIKYRKKSGLTQEELAKKSGYSYSYIRKIEGPESPKNFSLLTLYNISNALNVNIKCLFEDNDI